MIKLLTIVGARPQFIKAAALSRAIKNNFSNKISEIILHTGQHYDDNMSQVFFDEMQIPKPLYNLNVGSGSHARQTAALIIGIEEILLKEKPDYCVVFGDTNSTLAGSIAASKILVPIIHIEAGLRSYDKSMPEEINRVVCDHLSTLLFAPTDIGYKNLIKEGFNASAKPPYSMDNPYIGISGDIMYDNTLFYSEIAEKKSTILSDNNLTSGNFLLATIHRDFNTDNPERLTSIFNAFIYIANKEKIKIVLPLHPRTRKSIENNFSDDFKKLIFNNSNFCILPGVSFFDIMKLENHAQMVFTDSGGVQKEAFFFNKPCIILRKETEWTELVENGAALTVDTDEKKIFEAYSHFKKGNNINHENIFGDGHAAEYICNEILKFHQ